MADERAGCAESVRAFAADFEGRIELRALATRLGVGGDVLAAVEERTVTVILSAWQPVVLDMRDNLSRRLAGQAAADAIFRLAAHPAFGLPFAFTTVLFGSALPLSAAGVLSAPAMLGIWIVEMMFVSTLWGLFSWPLLVMMWRCVVPWPRVREGSSVSPALLALLARFQYSGWDFWYLMGHVRRHPLRTRLRCRVCTALSQALF
jgi:hypothetical protein